MEDARSAPPSGKASAGGAAPRWDGELDESRLARRLYSQDASLYQETPRGVARPRDADDLERLARFAAARGLPLIPRAGGTSLAGQCVGDGLVVDVTRHMNRILALDPEGRRAVVEPGVVQDDLNDAAAPHGLLFAPDTSTSRQAAIGGMIGNNSCGAYSVLHGTTRDHVLELDAVLADGSRVRFGPMSDAEFEARQRLDTAEGRIYRAIAEIVGPNRAVIEREFPKPAVRRRNMGYALDALAAQRPWTPAGPPLNLVPLICGSEGTLCLVAGATVRLISRPRCRAMLCAHFEDVDAAARATRVILEHAPAAVELMDGALLEATRRNRAQARNRFWVRGTPGAVLAIELHDEDPDALARRGTALAERLERERRGYAWPWIAENDIARVWALRKAGLGLLQGVPGDAKPVTAIEDTAVAAEDLADYLRDIRELMRRRGCDCVYYGHASVGVIHLRPMLNLKDPRDFETFRRLLEETADLVKRYRGSLSGEHGDGRLRSACLPRMFSPAALALMERIKDAFDPDGRLNPGKIVRAVSPFASLRAGPGAAAREPATAFDWSRTLGFARAVEACNGAGFCRQSPGRGGMCPTYMATREEADSTRGRANVLRQLIAGSAPERAWRDPDLWAVLDRCLSCKACATECPSSVDLARMKAEALHQRMRECGAPPRSRVFGHYARLARLARMAPRLATALANWPPVKRALGIAPERRLSPFARQSFSAWFRGHAPGPRAGARGAAALFVDEFVEYSEPEVGIAAVEVMEAAGWRVEAVRGLDSARALISKGFLDAARRRMESALARLAPLARRGLAIVGLEPSAALGFRDEAPDLVSAKHRDAARAVREAVRLFPEWIAEQREAGALASDGFGPLAEGAAMLVHGHCHQKALGAPGALRDALSLIPQLSLIELPTACCGMAGAFGYEREHYALSMQVGETLLFPAIRRQPQALLCADGFSCRHQILDGTGRRARHSAEWLRAALRTRQECRPPAGPLDKSVG